MQFILTHFKAVVSLAIVPCVDDRDSHALNRMRPLRLPEVFFIVSSITLRRFSLSFNLDYSSAEYVNVAILFKLSRMVLTFFGTS